MTDSLAENLGITLVVIGDLVAAWPGLCRVDLREPGAACPRQSCLVSPDFS
jgi:hypothetical protein